MTVATAKASALERAGVSTFKGNPLTLLGPEIRPGDRAPEFQVLAQDLTTVKLSDGTGKALIVSVVPSLDTPVCDAQTRRFNEEASRLSGGIEIWTISMDLPFAQRRWCGAAGIDRVKVFSDHRDASFGLAYGCVVKELRLLARAVFLIDKDGVVRQIWHKVKVGGHVAEVLKAVQAL